MSKTNLGGVVGCIMFCVGCSQTFEVTELPHTCQPSPICVRVEAEPLFIDLNERHRSALPIRERRPTPQWTTMATTTAFGFFLPSRT